MVLVKIEVRGPELATDPTNAGRDFVHQNWNGVFMTQSSTPAITVSTLKLSLSPHNNLSMSGS
jgi:hypothetical protein